MTVRVLAPFVNSPLAPSVGRVNTTTAPVIGLRFSSSTRTIGSREARWRTLLVTPSPATMTMLSSVGTVCASSAGQVITKESKTASDFMTNFQRLFIAAHSPGAYHDEIYPYSNLFSDMPERKVNWPEKRS